MSSMKIASIQWPVDLICRQATGHEVIEFAPEVYRLTCRTDFDAPGFCLLNLGRELTSSEFRRAMVELMRAMSVIHEAVAGDSLTYLSAARFDQQTSTKPHLDGGPGENFLMLGYEPSEIASQPAVYDYSRCALDHGIQPRDVMEKHNPMFRGGLEMLQPYATELVCFSARDYQIVCINNSCTTIDAARTSWLGTLHTALVPKPDESKRRVINSTMICPTRSAGDDRLSDAALEEFLATTRVSRRGYDKTHLDDDG